MNYYGIIQSANGADHLWIFDEKELLKELNKYGIPDDVLPNESEKCSEIDNFPIMNASPSGIVFITSENEIKQLLTMQAPGPDYADPPLIAYSEYYWRIETEKGCAGEWIEKFNYDKEELEKKAVEHLDEICDNICKSLNITKEQFYKDEYRDIRYSDAVEMEMFYE